MQPVHGAGLAGLPGEVLEQWLKRKHTLAARHNVHIEMREGSGLAELCW
ncbi:MAG TPA: hypothetical protein VJU82_08730 [Acidobacteriaceae bacterium]|nr:hypothetical protein [Acidobacteriaceae bacterium]